MIAVSTAPATTPSTGFSNIKKRFLKPSISASGFTAPLIVSIPIIRIAKPAKIEPMSFFLLLFVKSKRQTPISARIGAKEDGFNIWITKFSPSIPVRLKIQDVIVVPIFAPMIIPTACFNCMIPEFTNPTTITVVAEDDWITAVTPAPSNTAVIGFAVNFSKIISSFPPDIFANPSPMICIPYKNNARPPSIVNTLKKFMAHSFHHIFPMDFINSISTFWTLSFIPAYFVHGQNCSFNHNI